STRAQTPTADSLRTLTRLGHRAPPPIELASWILERREGHKAVGPEGHLSPEAWSRELGAEGLVPTRGRKVAKKRNFPAVGASSIPCFRVPPAFPRGIRGCLVSTSTPGACKLGA